MTRDRIEEMRNEYTVDGKLDVGPDDPRFQEAMRNMTEDERARLWGPRTTADSDLAERGHADVARESYDSHIARPVLTHFQTQRELYRRRLAEQGARLSRAAAVGTATALFVGLAIGFIMGVWIAKAGGM